LLLQKEPVFLLRLSLHAIKVELSVKAVHFKVLQLEFFVSLCSASKLLLIKRFLDNIAYRRRGLSKMWHLCSFKTSVAFFSGILPHTAISIWMKIKWLQRVLYLMTFSPFGPQHGATRNTFRFKLFFQDYRPGANRLRSSRQGRFASFAPFFSVISPSVHVPSVITTLWSFISPITRDLPPITPWPETFASAQAFASPPITI